MRESNQDQKIMRWIKDRYGNACRLEKRHANRYTERGLPDLNIVVYGMSIQIEDKIIKEFPRDEQLLRLLEYETSGAISFWADTFEMFVHKWETMVEGDPRFQFLKSSWKNKEDMNWAKELISYKSEQEENRREWLLKYKEDSGK